jgi:ABC-type Mn2+/Zn2+ transport system permease subunit
MMRIGVAIGVGAAVSGLYLLYWLDVASGATIVLVETAFFFVALVLGPSTGLLGAWRSRRATLAET